MRPGTRHAAAFTVLAATVAVAQAPSAQPANTGNNGAGVVGDRARGAAIASGTRQACAPGNVCFPCFQCHEVKGEGKATPGIPRLTGQAPGYLVAALKDFASGKRASNVMQPIAKALSDQDIGDVAAYYASLHVNTDPSAWQPVQDSPSREDISRGGVLAAIGSEPDHIQACGNCHGPSGAGLPPDFPFLAGQYDNYLVEQLQAFASGKRPGGEFNVMQTIAAHMSAQQIHDVAAYYASIRPATPTPYDVTSPGTPAAPDQHLGGGP